MKEVPVTDIHFVEDSNDEAFVSRLLLKKDRIKVNLVHHSDVASFRRALDLRQTNDVFLAFVDLNMPGMKGTEIISAVRAQSNDNVVLGICSGSDDPEDIRLSFQAGARFFINKPLGRSAIENVCRSVPGVRLNENTDGSVEILVSVQ